MLWTILTTDRRDADGRDSQMAFVAVQDLERKYWGPRGILGRKRASADLRGYGATYGSNPYPTRR